MSNMDSVISRISLRDAHRELAKNDRLSVVMYASSSCNIDGKIGGLLVQHHHGLCTVTRLSLATQEDSFTRNDGFHGV